MELDFVECREKRLSWNMYDAKADGTGTHSNVSVISVAVIVHNRRLHEERSQDCTRMHTPTNSFVTRWIWEITGDKTQVLFSSQLPERKVSAMGAEASPTRPLVEFRARLLYVKVNPSLKETGEDEHKRSVKTSRWGPRR